MIFEIDVRQEGAEEAEAALKRLKATLADTAPAKAYKSASASIRSSLASVRASVVGVGSSIATSVKGIVGPAMASIGAGARRAIAPVSNAMSKVRDSVRSTVDSIKKTKLGAALSDMFTVGKYGVGRAVSFVRGGLSKVKDGIAARFSKKDKDDPGSKASGEKTSDAKAEKAAKAAEDKRKKKEEKDRQERKKNLKEGAGKAGGMLGGLGMAVAATAGVAGASGLASIALGAKGMAQLQAISARTAIGFKSLFKGVDPGPVVRAFELFSRNFTNQTATGRVLGDVMTRSFNGIFSIIERAEPYVSSFVTGFISGFLQISVGVKKAVVSMWPLVSSVILASRSVDGLGVAANIGKVALVGLGAYAIVAAAPFLAVAAAITAASVALDQFGKLMKEWDENSSSQIWRKLKSDLGVGGSQQDKERAQGIVQGDDFDKAQAAKGQGVGKAMGDGMVAGMAASEAAVEAAGGKLAKAAERGAKSAAEIKSPSRKMRREVGRQLGEGVARGEEDMAGRVQNAAKSSLVPDAGGLNLSAVGGRGSMPTIQLLQGAVFHIHGTEELETRIRDVIQGEVGKVKMLLGGT